MIMKALVTTAGVALAGIVGYKVIKKKNPKLIKKVKKGVSELKDGASDLIGGAKESFQEGFTSS